MNPTLTATIDGTTYSLGNVSCLPLKIYCKLMDCTADSIRTRLKRGVWLEGREAFKDDCGHWHVDVRAVEAWVKRRYRRRG